MPLSPLQHVSRSLSRATNSSVGWLKAQRMFWLDYLVLGVILASVTAGILAIHQQYFPDTAHYMGMSLWFTGMSQQEALAYVNERHLAAGFELNTSVEKLFDWGLVKPRVVLPALAVPFVLLFGPNGLGVTTVLLTVVLVFVLYKLLSSRYGRFAAVATLALMMCSFYIMVFNIGMLTESATALWGALSLVAAYRYQQTGSARWIVVMVAVTALSGFTRQATFIAGGAFVIAWLASLVLRTERGRWGVPALAIAGTAIVVQLLQSWLFPTFSQLDQFVKMTGTSSLGEALLATPELVRSILTKDLRSFIVNDQALIVIIALSLISMVVLWRRSESHLLLGAILGVALYNITNGNATDFRYAIPGLVFFMVSIALLMSRIQSRALVPQAGSVPGDETPSFAASRSSTPQ